MGVLRVGYDAKRITANRAGLGNYSRDLVRALSDTYGTEGEFHLFSAKPGDETLYQDILLRPNVRMHTARGIHQKPLLRDLWRNWSAPRLAKREGVTIYHGLSNEIPRFMPQGVRSVVTIHDTIYEVHPEYYAPADVRLYRAKYGRSCRRADVVVAISESTKRDVMRFYGVPGERIRVIYQGCHAVYSEPVTEEDLVRVRIRYSLPARYVVCVGTVETRKNSELLIRALPGLPEDIEVVLVGRKTPYAQRVTELARELGVAKRLHILEGVPLGDLPALYRGALVSAYVSRYEGFGIPIIEAQSVGTPVVAASGSSLQEAGGEGALYVDPDDPRGLAEAINEIESRNELRERLIQAGRESVLRFTSTRIVASWRELYTSLG